jgi:transcriptional regulator with XRE-family HTH domain
MPEKRQDLMAARAAKSLTRAKVAESAGVSVDYIHKIEAGLRLPGRNMAFKLAEVYGVPIDTFKQN